VLQQFLNSLPGIVYIIDPNEKIQYYTRSRWNEFAQNNDAPDMAAEENILGHSLFDFIDGEEVRESYRDFQHMLWTGRRNLIPLTYRCDAPSIRREMYMEMSKCAFGDDLEGILYRSVPVHTQQRPALEFLSKERQNALLPDAPIVTICSYCLDLRDKDTGEWIRPEEYYRRGGEQDVALSHGICTECMETKIRPLLN